MHELSVTKAIFKTVMEKFDSSKMKSVVKIYIVVGEVQNYEEKWIQHYFKFISKGTPCENSEIVVIPKKILFKCNDCGAEFTLNIRSDEEMVCKNCKSENYKMISGKEFYIDRIETEMK